MSVLVNTETTTKHTNLNYTNPKTIKLKQHVLKSMKSKHQQSRSIQVKQKHLRPNKTNQTQHMTTSNEQIQTQSL